MAATVAAAAAAGVVWARRRQAPAPDVRLMTLDPGHFHAALVQKEMYPGVAGRVDVYAPLGPELAEHVRRIAAFNARRERPTAWELEVHAAPDSLPRLLRERPGNVVILSGRNRPKIDQILASVQAGLHVLADKPWVLRSDDLPRLEAALAEADARGLVAYDIMTERFEVTNLLQRALVHDEATFGTLLTGTADDPAVYMESVHYLMKTVAGAPNIRPAWFFDTGEQGEALSDVGTHLVDLVQWTLQPDQAIDYRSDIRITGAYRWPTRLSEADFRRVTGAAGFSPQVEGAVTDGALDYYCNTFVSYTIRGVHTSLNIVWDWEAQPGAGDTHFACYRGSRARVEVRQTRADGDRPELYLVPNEPSDTAQVLAAARARIRALQHEYPGVAVEERGAELHVAIPDEFRTGHEAHFAEVAQLFLRYLEDRRALPAWERPNMLAKYYLTTTGTELSRQSPPRVASRRTPA
jgi:predicted dehydrogenase